MNYYKHYLGDYARDTAHLSLLEHGAYRVLLDTYYATEKSLPADQASLYRICKAFSAAERKAVDLVADQFFPVNGDGSRHNVRADEEIAKWSAQAETNRAIAEAREQKRKAHELSTNSITNGITNRSTNRLTNAEPLQKPEPLPEKEKSKTLSGRPDLKPQALEVLNFLNEKANRAYRPTMVNLELIEGRLKEGASVADCRMVIARKCREWLSEEKMAPYLRPKTLFNRTNFSQYIGECVNVA